MRLAELLFTEPVHFAVEHGLWRKKIDICLVVKQMCCSPLEDFLIGGFVASPFANDILALKQSTRREMFQTIRNSISDYIDDHGLAAPMECYIVSAVT